MDIEYFQQVDEVNTHLNLGRLCYKTKLQGEKKMEQYEDAYFLLGNI